MNPIYLILPEEPSPLMEKMIHATIQNQSTIVVNDTEAIPDLTNTKILFAIELNDAGYNINLYKFFTKLWERGSHALSGSIGMVLIHCNNELFTKTAAQSIIFQANQLGCRFPGRPLVEATGSLSNLLTLQKIMKGSLEDVCLISCKDLGERLIEDAPSHIAHPKILVLHGSNYQTSNTLMLWDMIKRHLEDLDIKEIHIENGTVRDCIGCPYKTCKHYGEQTSCFYGGIMVEEIYPAILESDAIIWICPNYNDAIAANLTAVINRLTALFRKTKFYDKSLFSIIVSGNSGSDAIAKQLISALNINKTFRLPPYFCIMATANNRNAIYKVPKIEEQAKAFAENLITEIKA